MAAETSEWGDLLARLAETIRGRINVCTPAKVVSYDPGTGYAIVQPDLALAFRDVDANSTSFEQAPQIEQVPVLWPVWSGGGCGIVGRLEHGDQVTLVLSDRSLDEWKTGAEAPLEPLDNRRQQLTDAYALVGGLPASGPLPASAQGAMTLHGKIKLAAATALDPVVTESRLLEFLNGALNTWLASHTHSGVTTGPGTSGPPLPASLPPTASDLGSPDVEAT